MGFMDRAKVYPREVDPSRLGWVGLGGGVFKHRVTGQLWRSAPGAREVILVPPWVDDEDLREMTTTGGLR